MRKLILVIVLFSSLFVLTACKDEASQYNFRPRKDDYLISDDGNIIIEYKTDGDGKLINLSIDRLLTIEEMIYLNPNIDYDVTLEGFNDDIFVDPGFLCTNYDIMVPVNLEIGSTRLVYDEDECEYREVDRNNDIKVGSFVLHYDLDDTIEVSKDTVIAAAVFDENSLERFVDIYELPHTFKSIGVYNVIVNSDRDGFRTPVTNYDYDMSVFAQLVIKHQESATAIEEIEGISSEVNLLDLDDLTELSPLIEDFNDRYELEIAAIEELEETIGKATGEAQEGDPTGGDEEESS